MTCPACSVLREELENAHGAHALLLDKYEALVDKTLELKRDGFTVPPNYGEPVVTSPPMPPEVIHALDEIKGAPELRARLQAYAWDALRDGGSPELVAANIKYGQPVAW